MLVSNYIAYIKKWMRGIVQATVEKLNDTKRPPTYLHKRMLRPEFSITGKWESLVTYNSLVAADVVSMDSQLPLKKRGKLETASGDIPKMGMKLKLNETQLTALDTLIATRQPETLVVEKLFADTPRVIGGVFERNEAIFLEGLSTGVALVEDTENVGIGIRLDYGYLTANKFGVTTVWSNVASTPFNDIDRVLAKAKSDGHVITRLLLDKTAFDNMAKTTQAKELFAFRQGFVGSNIPTPDFDQINALFTSRYRFPIELVERTVRYEINGAESTQTPWQDGMAVFVTSDVVGTLTWATLAESNHPVEGVRYETADQYILVSKYRTNEPLTEWTSSQARVVPVIGNVDQIYTLDSKTVQA